MVITNEIIQIHKTMTMKSAHVWENMSLVEASFVRCSSFSYPKTSAGMESETHVW